MKLTIVALCLFSSMAHASYFVQCGTGFNEEEFSFKEVVFKASSQDDTFTGSNGDVWSVALKGDWLPENSAKASVKDGIVTVSFVNESRVGKRFEVTGMYDDHPVLRIYNIGGFAGGVKIGTFQCATAID
jgi:hypothetical protein